jgi:hypothetical protein
LKARIAAPRSSAPLSATHPAGWETDRLKPMAISLETVII